MTKPVGSYIELICPLLRGWHWENEWIFFCTKLYISEPKYIPDHFILNDFLLELQLKKVCNTVGNVPLFSCDTKGQSPLLSVVCRSGFLFGYFDSQTVEMEIVIVSLQNKI